MPPSNCSVSLSDNLENMGDNIDLCIIIVIFHYLPNNVVLFCLEMNWHYFVINIIDMYHVRKKLYELLYTFGPETKIKYLYILVRFMFFVEYCYNIDTVIYLLHSPPYSRYVYTTFNYVAL